MCQVTKLSVYYSIFLIFVLQLKLWLNECYFGANFDARSASKTVRLTQVMRADLCDLIELASKWRMQEQLKRSLVSSHRWDTPPLICSMISFTAVHKWNSRLLCTKYLEKLATVSFCDFRPEYWPLQAISVSRLWQNDSSWSWVLNWSIEGILSASSAIFPMAECGAVPTYLFAFTSKTKSRPFTRITWPQFGDH